jgi:NAD(P)-dependent dehydrogenase (short-subunit alcohol dehydrogenase family)
MSRKWTEKDISNIEGKVIIVTGGNSGLGFESVKMLAAKGAIVILASRSKTRGFDAKATILEAYPKANVDVMALDLGSFKSIEVFSNDFLAKYDRLDVLLNNAGIMMTPYGKTEDGLEQQIGVNHFGHFALTARLFDRLKSTPGSRVVNISSIAHRSGVMNFDNLMYEDGVGYNPSKVYSQSKLANLLFTYELHRKVEEHHLDMKILAAHPGVSVTNLVRHMAGKWVYKLIFPLFKLFAQTAYQGALPGIRAAVDPTVESGTYYGPDRRNEVVGDPVLVEARPQAYNKEDAKRLWEMSEEITGVSFNL